MSPLGSATAPQTCDGAWISWASVVNARVQALIVEILMIAARALVQVSAMTDRMVSVPAVKSELCVVCELALTKRAAITSGDSPFH